MTKDEIFERYWGHEEQREGSSKKSAKGVFETFVVPYLNVPRSLIDDPPKQLPVFIWCMECPPSKVNRIWCKFTARCWPDDCAWWLPDRPDAPQESRDEIEFEAWYATTDIRFNIGKDELGKNAVRRGWLAARKIK